jgi:putative transposase
MDLGAGRTEVKFLIKDRAGEFISSFEAVFHGGRHQDSRQRTAGAESERDLRRIVGTLRWELFDRSLVVNEHDLRRVLTEYLRHCNAAWPSPVPLTRFRRLKGAPDHRRSTSLSTGSAENKVLGGLTYEYQVTA